MREVFMVADNIVSPLGDTAAANFRQLALGRSGIALHSDPALSPVPVYASLLDQMHWERSSADRDRYTKFERLLIHSISDSLSQNTIDPCSERTVLILSSTKGNIGLLESDGDLDAGWQNRIALHTSARLIANHFSFRTKPVVVSHACISGLVALITGLRLLQSGRYDHAIVAGADLITKFVLSGFQSFQAISSRPCRPFDASRDGITLGEAAGTIILSTVPSGIQLSGGAVSNDANHISGPSRTGQELFQAVAAAMKAAGVTAPDIGFISAHGTATLYNDEMEAKALNLAGLQLMPANSLKGNFGHTLGAAGIIETVIAIHSLRENIVLPTSGFSVQGTSLKLNISSDQQKGFFNACLKTASGFGGCNAAIVLQKSNQGSANTTLN